MPETQDTLAVEALLESLETMAFVTLMPLDAPAEAPPELRRIRIEFSTPRPGALTLLAPAALGRLIAANILGADPSDPEVAPRADDALCELMNITCGSILRQRADHTAAMGLPRVETADAAEWRALASDPATHLLDADGCPIALHLKGV